MIVEKSKQLNLTITIIGHNNERHLRELLPTLNWVNEVLYLDCESEDDSIKIAQKNGAKVFKKKNDFNFYEKRNFINNKSKNEWVFFLDPDERVPENLKIEIIEKFKTNPTNNAFSLKRRNFFFAKFLAFGGFYPDIQTRIYQKSDAWFPKSYIHEKLAFKNKNAIHLENDLLHYSYDSIKQYFDKFNFYTSLEAKNLLEKKLSINAVNFLSYFFLKPLNTFLGGFFFKRGYKDGFSGFLAAFFSALNFPLRYAKLWELHEQKNSLERSKASDREEEAS